MNRYLPNGLVFGALGILATACGSHGASDRASDGASDGAPSPEAPLPGELPPGGSTPEIPQNSGSLLDSYHVIPNPYWEAIKYRPRQFVPGTKVDPMDDKVGVDDPGPFAGWDVLNAPSQGVQRIQAVPNWLTLRLRRDARVAVVWRGGSPLPAWLGSFEPSGQVVLAGVAYPTFAKSLGAGETAFGAVYDPGMAPPPGGRLPYLVLFGEKDGRASATPQQPTGLPPALPNESCPAWVHDQYVTTGPDGGVYRTWHRAIDPVFWCYFHHEHGSDPSSFAGTARPAFNYTGMGQGHEGFKVYVFHDPSGYDWMITQHFGTSSITRVCTRFHTTDIAIAHHQTGDMIADLHLMGDYGGAVVNATDAPFKPAACPDQSAALGEVSGSGLKKLPTVEAGSIGYEPWRLGGVNTGLLGLIGGSLTVNTHDGQTICADTSCDSPVYTGNPGTDRGLQAETAIVPGGLTGTFYTDAYGKARLDPTDPSAKKQYVRPGTGRIVVSPTPGSGYSGHYLDPWTARVEFIQNSDPRLGYYGLRNVEASLRLPN